MPASKNQTVRYFVESWPSGKGGQFVPVGVWYQVEGGGVQIWYKPEYDKKVHDFDSLGGAAAQWENYLVEHDVDLSDRGLLEYYSEQGGQSISRSEVYSISTPDVDPERLIDRAGLMNQAAEAKPTNTKAKVVK